MKTTVTSKSYFGSRGSIRGTVAWSTDELRSAGPLANAGAFGRVDLFADAAVVVPIIVRLVGSICGSTVEIGRLVDTTVNVATPFGGGVAGHLRISAFQTWNALLVENLQLVVEVGPVAQSGHAEFAGRLVVASGGG